MPALSAATIINIQRAVQDSDSQTIRDTLLSIKSNTLSDNWLDPRNKYLLNTIGKIKDDLDVSKPLHRFNAQQIKEYIAISSLLHCKDGWGFLTDSIASLVEGNISNCVHMAYYAELRAAMSFLASDGIGVFNNKHIWFDNTGTYNVVSNAGTHDFVWKAIEEWANVQPKSFIVLKSFNVEGKSIFEWLVAAGMSRTVSTTTSLTKDWLKTWSLDLRVLGDDHLLRNEVSYRPQEIKRSSGFNVSCIESLKFIINKWSLTEPTSSQKFNLLDKYLLRQALYNYYQNQYARDPGIRDIRSVISALGFTGSVALENFLTKVTNSTTNEIFKTARKNALGNNGKYRPFAVISRAFLLLRLSTCILENNLSYAGYTTTDLDFWWKDLGVKNCLWEPGSEPTQVSDLWADVEVLINDISAYISRNPTAHNYAIHRNISKEVLDSRKFQRMYLWGIGL
jgi:hypothetical protein